MRSIISWTQKRLQVPGRHVMKQPDTAAKAVPALKSTAGAGGGTPPDPAGEDGRATCAGQAAANKGIEIDFDRAGFEGCELEFIEQAVRGRHISGDGPFTHNCQVWLE